MWKAVHASLQDAGVSMQNYVHRMHNVLFLPNINGAISKLDQQSSRREEGMAVEEHTYY